jgi:hypothetical protein
VEVAMNTEITRNRSRAIGLGLLLVIGGLIMVASGMRTEEQVKTFQESDSADLNFWIHYEDRAIEIRNQMYATLTWLLALLIGLMGYILSSIIEIDKFLIDNLDNLNNEILKYRYLTDVKIFSLIALSLIGVFSSWFLIILYKSFTEHMLKNIGMADAIKDKNEISIKSKIDSWKKSPKYIAKVSEAKITDSSKKSSKKYDLPQILIVGTAWTILALFLIISLNELYAAFFEKDLITAFYPHWKLTHSN